MKLRYLNDPVLREVCAPVELSELDFVVSQVPEMTKILLEENGTALAANQVGITKRFFIAIVNQDTKAIGLFINPEIVKLGDLEPFNEGCLSIPGTSADTQRAQSLELKYLNEKFEECEVTFTGLIAVAIQHEIDHLDGKLYIDQLPPMRKLLVVDKHRKFVKQIRRRK